MKKQLLVILLLMCSAFSVFFPTSVATEYIIDGDKVYIDDEYVYLSVEPHTITEDTDVVFELISKQFSGEIDVAFGINNTFMSVKNPRLWNGTAWNPLNKEIVVKNVVHQGYNKWYLLKNVNVNEDVLYKLKLTVDIVFNTSGKYFFGVKRSIDPISQGYYIDPWWSGNWLKYRLCTISNTYIDNDLVNFTVNVTINSTIASDCNAWGADIRFIAPDNTTEYSYEIENWSASGNSPIWVKIPRIESGTDTTFLMYYNNTAATDNQDVTGTWNSNFLAVYHMNDTTDSKYTYNLTNNGANSNSSGRIGRCYDYVSADTDSMSHATFLDSFPNACTMESWHLRDADGSSMQVIGKVNLNSQDSMGLQYHTNDLTKIRLGIEGSGQGYKTDYVASAMPKDKWHYAAGTYEKDTVGIAYLNATSGGGTGSNINEIRDGTYTDFYIGMIGGSYPFDGRIDEVRISNVKRNASWIKATYHSVGTSAFLTIGSEVPSNAPTDFNATTSSTIQIDLTWTKGTDSTYTYIMQKTGSYPTSRTDGTNIYNNTGVSFSDTSVSSMTVYYYSAWGYNTTTNSYSNGFAVDSNDTSPANPTSISSLTGAAFINFTWVMGARADNTTIVHKVDSYPTNPQDGSEIYNGSTPLYYNDTTFYSGFYTFYSWNSTYNRFSDGDDYEYGKLTINCYDENTSVAIANWNCFITNEDGSSTYESTGNTNPLIIDPSTIPYGAKTIIKINATWYNFRLYFMDIYLNNQYTLDTYLPPENITKLYVLSVIDPLDNSVSDAEMQIKQYINATEGYKNVSIRYTDAEGHVDVYLIPETTYKIIISKTGFQTEYATYVPSATILVRTFGLEFADETEQTIYIFNNVIDFDATAYSNGSIRVRYADSSLLTTNTQFYMYNSYNSIDTLEDTETRTGEDTITYWVTGLNLSKVHYVNLYFNHTYDFEETQPVRIIILPINGTTTRTQLSFEAAITSAIGQSPNNIGWGNLIACFTAIIILVGFSPFNAGVGIIGAGASFSVIEIMFVINNIYILATMPLIIFIGIFYILATREPGGHL